MKDQTMTRTASKSKNIVIWVGFLVSAFIAAFFYIRSEIQYYSTFDYNLHDDYVYAFPSNSTAQVEVGRNGFDWPASKTSWDTAFLKINVSSDWSSLFFKPFIVIRYHGEVIRQYFEKTARGIRYLNLSRLAGSITPPGTPSDKIELKGHHISWKQGLTELYRFQNADINKEKILIIAPHPDDAEIATFGLYDHRDAYIVAITAGENGKPRFKKFFSDKKEHALFQGMVRTWDSVTVPFCWGGLMPGRSVNLGYFDGTLKEMFKNPSTKVVSASGATDLGTFRKYNLSPLAIQDTLAPTWNNLVEDLSQLITLIQPTVIVTPNPLTDSHPDHEFSTIALFEAIQKSGFKSGSLYLYTVHDAYSSRWPFGKATSMVSLPPYFSKRPFFDKIYSYHLSQESFTRKLFALDDMHGFRPVYFLTPDKYSDSFPVILQSAYLQWKTLSQVRKYLRYDELFFVAPVEKAGLLREEFLKNPTYIPKKKACSPYHGF